MRLIDADVLKQHIDKLPALPDGNFAGNHSALKALINMQPTIEPSTNCSEIPNNSDTVSRQQAIDALQKCRKHCIDPFDSYHIDIQDAENQLSNLPTIQPVVTDTNVGDTISRQAAIDALNKQIQQCRKALGSLSLSDVDKHAVEVKMASLRAYRGMLENLPTIEPEPQWIPVSERLPRDGSWNIFTDGKNISVERYKADAIDHFFPNGRWFDLEDAVAWLPLPEPYKPNK